MEIHMNRQNCVNKSILSYQFAFLRAEEFSLVTLSKVNNQSLFHHKLFEICFKENS